MNQNHTQGSTFATNLLTSTMHFQWYHNSDLPQYDMLPSKKINWY